MAGRKPKPSYLRVLDGNAGHRPINHDEPKPVGDLADAPHWMTVDQRAGWDYAIRHSPPGLLKMLDRSALVTWVVAESIHRQAAEKIAQYGALVKDPDNDKKPMKSPWIPILNEQARAMMRAASELGFTPSSRSRVKVSKPTPGASPFAGLKELGD